MLRRRPPGTPTIQQDSYGIPTEGKKKEGNPTPELNTPWAPSGPERIEDAMRRDTATPSFWGLAFRDPFQQVVRAGLCLPIFWLILFDLVRPCQIL